MSTGLKAAVAVQGALVVALGVGVLNLRGQVRRQADAQIPPVAALVPAPPPAAPPPDPIPLAPMIPPPAPVPPAPPGLEEALERMLRDTCPALLHIENRKEGGLGSGFLIDEEGRGMTNAHVVGEARDVRIMLYNGAWVSAKVLARDYAMDLALVQLDMRNEATKAYVRILPFGDSSTLKPGQMAAALGSPHGLSRSISFGIVGHLGRFGGAMATPRGGVSGLMNVFLQTDAAINPGNSGGPLVTLDGKVIGINSRGYPHSDGLGLAIPINTAKEILADLKAAAAGDGQVERNLLGVDLGPFRPDEDDLEWAYKLEKGVKVLRVFPDSPAAAAGLETGDVISRIGDLEVNASIPDDVPSAYRAIDRLKPGQEFEIEVQRREPVVLKVKGMGSLAFHQSIRMDPIGAYARAPYDTEVRGEKGAVITGRIETFPGYNRDAEDQLQVGDVIKGVDGVPAASFEAIWDQVRSSEGPMVSRQLEVIRGKKTVHIRLPYGLKAAAATPDVPSD